MPIDIYGAGTGGGGGTGDVKFTDIDRQSVIYVSKDGNDSNDGENIGQPKLTIGSAITAASAKTPTDTNIITVEVLDSGVYSEGIVTVPSFVVVRAVEATLEGTYLLEDNSTLEAFRMRNVDTSALIGKTSGTGNSSYSVGLMDVTSGEIGVGSTSGSLSGRVDTLLVDAGTGITTLNAAARTYMNVNRVILSNGGIGVNVASTGVTVDLKADSVVDDTTGTAINCTVNGATINFNGGEVVVTSLFNIAGLSTLNYNVANGQGATAAITGSTIRGVNPTGNTTLQGNLSCGDSLFIETTNKPMNVYNQVSYNATTGIVDGGKIIAGTVPASEVTIQAGTGVVSDAATNPTNPTVTIVEWPEFKDVTPTNIATEDFTAFGVDSSGSLVQQNSEFTRQQLRSIIRVGDVVHIGGTIQSFTTFPVISPQNGLLGDDILDATGAVTKFGLVVFPNAGGNLNIDFTSGTILSSGLNYENDMEAPNDKSVSGVSAFSFSYFWQNGSGGANFGAPTTNVDPTQWDDGSGTLQTVPGQDYTIQRVWFLPTTEQWFISYGQTVYPNVAQARQNFALDPFGGFDQESIANLVLRAAIIVREDQTDLTDDTGNNATYFVQAGKFGEFAGGAAGGTTDLQGAYNNSTSPEIITNSTLGCVEFRQGSGSDTDGVICVQNGVGTETFSSTGNGDVTANSLSLNSNLAMNGNNIVGGGDAAFTGDVTIAGTILGTSAVTVAGDDKVLIKDTNDADNLQTVTAQSIADLASFSPNEQSFTATASQTNFTLSSTPEAAWVWKNGAAQDASTWSISGDDIVLSTAADSGDAIEVYYLTGSGTLITEANTLIAINNQTGTSYTPVIGDASKKVRMNNALSNTFTVPPNSSVAFPVGSVIYIHQTGAGTTTIAEGAGVTINYTQDASVDEDKLAAQNAQCAIHKVATDEWDISGALTT